MQKRRFKILKFKSHTTTTTKLVGAWVLLLLQIPTGTDRFLQISMAATQAMTAIMGRSLVDDTSTIKSDADTTLATEDTYPLKHESDMMLTQRRSSANSNASHSEDSRLYTDEDDDETSIQQQQQSKLLEDEDATDDERSWEFSHQHRMNEGSSANTGSTYDEAPFLQDRKYAPLEQKTDEERELEQQYEQQGEDMLIKKDDSWKNIPLVASAPSQTDDHGDNGYACEMIFETQNVMQRAKTKAGDCFRNTFQQHSKTEQETTVTPKEEGSSVGICYPFQYAIGACGDAVDGLLIKLFDVSGTTSDDPKNAVSVSESLINDRNHVLQAPIRSEYTMKRSETKKKTSHRDTAEDVDTPHASSTENSMNGMARDISQDDRDEHSDIRDDDDEILLEDADYDEYGFSHPVHHSTSNDSMPPSKASIYQDSEDKRESTSVASSINSDVKREKIDAGRESESDTDSVARVLDKYIRSPEVVDDHRIQVPSLDQEDDASQSDVSFAAMHQKHVQRLLQKTSTSKHAESTDDDSGVGDDNSVGNVRVSSLYGKHVVNLINKNLDATNRSKFIDLSQVDAGDEDELLDTDTLKSLAMGRSWHRKPNTNKTTAFDFDVNPVMEPSWHESSIIDEIDVTLHKRKEKLRKMMEDLSQTMENAVIGKATTEKRQDIIDVEAERGIDTADRIIHIPSQNEEELIDLTQYTAPIDLTQYEECY